MLAVRVYCIYMCILILWLTLSYTEQCRDLKFTKAFGGKRLINHVIRIVDVMDMEFCGAMCFMEDNCVSYNVMTRDGIGVQKCELNNATHEGQENDLEDNNDYVYNGAENACASNLCSDKATCQSGFTQRGYRCLCPAGITGQNCNIDIDECFTGTHSCNSNANCINTESSYVCSCKSGYHGDGRNCQDIDECAKRTHNCKADDLCNNTEGSFHCTPLSCKDIYDMNLSRENKAFLLRVGSDNILVYCVLEDAGLGKCGGGGWTLAMKIDGSKKTFHYDADLWRNKAAHNLAGGETGLDNQETKLPTYWNTPFSKICLGMKIPSEQTTHFIAINKVAASLYSLIADQQYRPTSLGRDTWKLLLGSQGSLQPNCNREGFNVISDDQNHPKARIGIINNNEDECISCDSRIGFGTSGVHDDSNTCGIDALADPDNGEKRIKAIGYIFIQ